jgi:hypothetical protein
MYCSLIDRVKKGRVVRFKASLKIYRVKKGGDFLKRVLKSVLRTRNILLRIRICGSVSLTNGSGSCYFWH